MSTRRPSLQIPLLVASIAAVVAGTTLLTACGDKDGGDSGQDGASGSDTSGSDTSGSDTSGQDTGADALTAVARCDYENPFSQAPECKEYLGAGWDLAGAEEDCLAPVPGASPGVLTAGEGCARDEVVGECVVAEGEDEHVVIVTPGTDDELCSGAELGCGFVGGTFLPGEVCTAPDQDGVPSEDAFQPFAQVCRDPVEGEPPGQGPDGQVCTWQAISGCTEEGRAFEDYADCEVILTQRPYYPYDAPYETGDDDPRLDDAEYMAELDWVTEQVEASACVCCHTADLPPDGPSGWSLDAGPLWLDTLDDDGLAMLAGWVDSTAFGAFPAEDNNGFHRDLTGLPTTDPARMQAFLVGELDRRGLVEADFADTEPFGGPLYDQLFHEPEPCADGQGVEADGTVVWTGGPARYLYVLEADAQSPGVPPNLDTPDGTRWRVDVDWTAAPLDSGSVTYGQALDPETDGAWQAFPADGAPAALVSGETYYLVALLDIYQPATRCLFTAP